MQENNFYIEYKIGETKRNENLETLFLKLKEEKIKYFETGIDVAFPKNRTMIK